MNHTITFSDIELQDLEGILIQPKRDGDGYSVHRIDKQKQEETWSEWVNSICGSYDKAIEKFRSALNRKLQSDLYIANNESARWKKEYLQACKKVDDIQVELEEKDDRIERLRKSCEFLEEKSIELKTALNSMAESAADWEKKYRELQRVNTCEVSMKKYHTNFLSKSKRLDEFKSDNNFDIWEARFSDHKTLNRVFKDYFLVDNDSEYELTNLIKGIESAFKRFNKVHELSMYEFFVYIGYFYFLRHLDTLTCKALINTKWTESNPFDCNLNIAPPCGEDDNTVSYYIVFSTAPKYVGDEN